MFNVGIIEFLIIIFVAVLFIKPKDLPVISKKLGLFYRKLNRYFYNLKSEFSISMILFVLLKFEFCLLK